MGVFMCEYDLFLCVFFIYMRKGCVFYCCCCCRIYKVLIYRVVYKNKSVAEIKISVAKAKKGVVEPVFAVAVLFLTPLHNTLPS